MTDFSTEYVEQVLTEQMTAHQVPGAAAAIVKNGEIIYARGFGHTSVETGAVPVDTNTLFRIGSVTKPLTGTMIMALVQQGDLDLDRSLGEYIPDLPVGRHFTLRMLLSHTSGLPSDLIYYPELKYSTREYVYERVPRCAPIAPAGKVYFYSNVGINLAAYVAEVVTGMSYPALMDHYLFQPLQMARTTFDLAMAATYPLAQPHVRDNEDRVFVKRPHIDNPAEYPCGFAFSTASDMAKFMLLHLGYGGQVLNSQSLAQMHRPVVDRMDGTGYGLTFRTGLFHGIRYVGHNGAIGKYGAIMRLHPDQDTGVFMVFNRAPGFWGAAGKIVNRMVIDLLGLPDEKDTKAYAPVEKKLYGTYLGYSTGHVVINEEGVCINGKDAPSARVGWVDERYIMVDGAPCERQFTPLGPDSNTDLAVYVGVYQADIDTWTVSVSPDDVLTIYSEDDRDAVAYQSLGDHRFAGEGGIVAFEFDENGHVKALMYANGYRFHRLTSANAR